MTGKKKKKKGDGRYRTVDTRTYADKKFLELSRPKPNAQTLWMYLLTGPHNTLVPGLFRATMGGLADELRWPRIALQNCWKEIELQGMAKADWIAGVVHLPNAMRYNPPENPNQVIGWTDYLREIPACELKDEACRRMREQLPKKDNWDAAALRAFGGTPPPTVGGTVTPTVGETVGGTRNRNRNRKNIPLRGDVGESAPGFLEFWAAYPRKVKRAEAEKAFAKLAPTSEMLTTILASVRQQQQRGCLEPRDGGKYIPYPASWLTGRRWEDEAPAPAGVDGGGSDFFQGFHDFIAGGAL